MTQGADAPARRPDFRPRAAAMTPPRRGGRAAALEPMKRRGRVVAAHACAPQSMYLAQ